MSATEEERQEAVEKVHAKVAGTINLWAVNNCAPNSGLGVAIDLQVSLTRAEELLRRAKPFVECVKGCECPADLLHQEIVNFEESNGK